ncbi:hypothetical protein BDV98DRAFT_404388 [Pterulicium gracile]|uniref:Uncharacterized protein n=1 Tax=Pterulicium gracile TaxID=1884261 RepID=A0A5C3QLI2_9AGAR|nr:hypothetical protein BDV98DRAFT_404388 [Pterula gracilis]
MLEYLCEITVPKDATRAIELMSRSLGVYAGQIAKRSLCLKALCGCMGHVFGDVRLLRKGSTTAPFFLQLPIQHPEFTNVLARFAVSQHSPQSLADISASMEALSFCDCDTSNRLVRKMHDFPRFPSPHDSDPVLLCNYVFRILAPVLSGVYQAQLVKIKQRSPSKPKGEDCTMLAHYLGQDIGEFEHTSLAMESMVNWYEKYRAVGTVELAYSCEPVETEFTRMVLFSSEHQLERLLHLAISQIEVLLQNMLSSGDLLSNATV